MLTDEVTFRISAMRERYAFGFVIKESMIIRSACAVVLEPAILRSVNSRSLEWFEGTYIEMKACWISSSSFMPLLICICIISFFIVIPSASLLRTKCLAKLKKVSLSHHELTSNPPHQSSETNLVLFPRQQQT